MYLSTLQKIVQRPKKRLGRGHGSGKVKTSGRGTKGQKARGSMPLGFEGGQLPLIKRVPFLRGKGRNASGKEKAFPVSLDHLEKIAANTTVTLDVLRKQHIIGSGVGRVKILASGKLSHALTVSLPCSNSAKAAIEKAGGKVL
jgi:large subunit ribosomal protein L15